MIESQNDAGRLSSIDGATALGQLADDAVLALAGWQVSNQLSAEGRAALQTLADWLERAAAILSDHLNLVLQPGGVDLLPGLDNFGPGVADAALQAVAAGLTGEREISAVEDLRAKILEVLSATAEAEVAEQLALTFEAVAKAMLTVVDSMLAPSSRSAWATTSAF